MVPTSFWRKNKRLEISTDYKSGNAVPLRLLTKRTLHT